MPPQWTRCATFALVFVVLTLEGVAYGELFFKVDGVVGGSTADGHIGWSELSSFTLRINRPGPSGRLGSAVLEMARYAMPVDRAYPVLLEALVGGKVFDNLKIEQTEQGVLTLDHLFENVQLASMLVSSSPTGPTNIVGTLAAEQLTTTYHLPDGGVVSRTWDIEGHAELILPATIGDFNADGLADGGDFLLWQRLLASGEIPFEGADGDGSGDIDRGDLSVWSAHFGAAAFTAATEAPEPSALMAAALSALTGFGALVRSRPRRRD